MISPVTDHIRPEIIARYHEEERKAWRERLDTIAARDEEYRALNRQFGCQDADGKFTSSYMDQAGPQYHARYRQISDGFQPQYDAISLREHEWRRQLGLTVAEFLFLDNFFSEHLDRLCADKRFAQSYRSELLRMKAGRNDTDKTRLNPEMEHLLAGLIAINAARAAVLCG